MKILVVSLLRLGDIIQQKPLLAALRKKFPGAELHLMMNDEFVHAQELFKDVVHQFHVFERKQYQQGLVEPSFNILWSFENLRNFILKLQAQKFDQVFNFTHTKLSAYLIGAIGVPESQGLVYKDYSFSGLENPWLGYFNRRFSGNSPSSFHYVELLGEAFKLPIQRYKAARIKSSDLILVQPLTNDIKKNWGLKNYSQLLTDLKNAYPELKFKVLVADYEYEQVVGVFAEADILVCSLLEAQGLLTQARVLITGDTSIKHLASQVGTPSLEISLGGSDSVKTGAFMDRSVVVSGEAPCRPCVHSKACHQKSQICAESVSVERVLQQFQRMLNYDFDTVNSESAVNKIVWKTYLEGSWEKSDTFTVTEFDLGKLEQKLKSLQDYLKQYEGLLKTISFSQETLERRDFESLILLSQQLLRSNLDTGFFFHDFLETFKGHYVNSLQASEALSSKLNEVKSILEINQKLVRSFQHISQEGSTYAEGPGFLS